jgi:hypothetical protein
MFFHAFNFCISRLVRAVIKLDSLPIESSRSLHFENMSNHAEIQKILAKPLPETQAEVDNELETVRMHAHKANKRYNKNNELGNAEASVLHKADWDNLKLRRDQLVAKKNQLTNTLAASSSTAVKTEPPVIECKIEREDVPPDSKLSSDVILAQMHEHTAQKRMLAPLLTEARQREQAERAKAREERQLAADYKRFKSDSSAQCITLENEIQKLRSYIAELEGAVADHQAIESAYDEMQLLCRGLIEENKMLRALLDESAQDDDSEKMLSDNDSDKMLSDNDSDKETLSTA